MTLSPPARWGGAAGRLDCAAASSGIHLPMPLLEQLASRCKPGRAAHEIARAFGDDHPQLPDQRIILGLQELAERARIRWEMPNAP
ncbi:MAG: hypothetical protein AAF772_20220 [Acidobacteriota bacterium]